MAFANDASDALTDTPTYAQSVAVALAIATALVFSTGRVFLRGYELPGSAAEAVMIGVIIATMGGGLIAGYRNDGLSTGTVIALGSPVGMAVYLVVVLWLEGPSSDSPTWLIYLVFVGFFLVVGGVGYGVGSATRQLR